ncbi:MAG: DUF4249 domain-containing protein [Bacteroidales bacterium]|nr:DUF4249 domain-containing protein [Bacteroidales bacterium]
MNKRIKQIKDQVTGRIISLTSIRLIGLIILPVVVLLNACEERYWPDLGNKYEKLLVVDGKITNQPGPYTIKLSESSTLLYPKYFPLTGYQLIISDDAGNSETLTETEEGTYSTAPDGIQGIIGRSYQLTVNDPFGKTYASEFEELLPPVEIDTVYANLEYRSNAGFSFDIPGYQFYISTKPGTSDTNYIRWQLEQTHQYIVDFKIYFYYDGTLHDFPNPDSLETCWLTHSIYSIYTSSTAGLEEPKIVDYPLHYISFDTREFSIRYSLLVEQLTISEKAQKYWSEVADQNTTGGDLYTRLPYQIQGNMHNILNENEPVLGYFQVAGADVKRIYIDRPKPPVLMYYSICALLPTDYEEYGWMFRINDWREWPKYVTVDLNQARAVPNPVCIDCRENGGTIVKPDFWED